MSVVAKVRCETYQCDQEFIIDSSTESIMGVTDNRDGTVTVTIVSYLRKESS